MTSVNHDALADVGVHGAAGWDKGPGAEDHAYVDRTMAAHVPGYGPVAKRRIRVARRRLLHHARRAGKCLSDIRARLLRELAQVDVIWKVGAPKAVILCNRIGGHERQEKRKDHQ